MHGVRASVSMILTVFNWINSILARYGLILQTKIAIVCLVMQNNFYQRFNNSLKKSLQQFSDWNTCSFYTMNMHHLAKNSDMQFVTDGNCFRSLSSICIETKLMNIWWGLRISNGKNIAFQWFVVFWGEFNIIKSDLEVDDSDRSISFT